MFCFTALHAALTNQTNNKAAIDEDVVSSKLGLVLFIWERFNADGVQFVTSSDREREREILLTGIARSNIRSCLSLLNELYV